ncbi:MAG: hypothetical protein MUE91_03835 [Ignavibacteriaceae bacterium]|nr:hypothetical protein [Ignavibacteriaceae bacterium]MCU0413524.1 hypothetical protein [Ignavibacteriaceae bacterium]
MKNIYLIVLLYLLTSSQIFAQNESGGKFSGLMFGDYFYNILRDSTIDDISYKAQTGQKDLNGFQFRRIYFTYDYTISDQFSTRFRLESQTQVGVNNTLFVVFVKDAFLKWKDIFEGSNLIFGIQPPPSFDVAEGYWGYRSLEKTIMDLRAIASSRDFGVALKGRINSGGTINYWLMYGNGNTLDSDGDKYKRAYAHLEFKPTENIDITVYGDYRYKADKSFSSLPDESFNNDALTTDIFIGYKEPKSFTIGVESFLQNNSNDVIQLENADYKVSNRNALGVSLFGWYRFSELLAGVGRFDYFDPNISSDFKGDSRNYFILGLSFILHEKVSITPNVLFETYEQPVNGVSIDPSLTGRITFNYEFL